MLIAEPGNKVYHDKVIFRAELLTWPGVFGLSYLQFLGYYLKKTKHKCLAHELKVANNAEEDNIGEIVAFDVFVPVARAEWDTLFFFYGVVLCVGGLGFLGYLSMVSELMYNPYVITNGEPLMQMSVSGCYLLLLILSRSCSRS